MALLDRIIKLLGGYTAKEYQFEVDQKESHMRACVSREVTFEIMKEDKIRLEQKLAFLENIVYQKFGITPGPISELPNQMPVRLSQPSWPRLKRDLERAASEIKG